MILSDKFPITFLVLFFFGSVLFAQKKNPEPYQPNRQEMLERYRKAQLLDSAIKNKVFKTNVHAHWQKNGNTFWYCNVLKDSVREYMYVDVARGTKQKAFNLEKLAVELGKALGKPLQAKHFVTV